MSLSTSMIFIVIMYSMYIVTYNETKKNIISVKVTNEYSNDLYYKKDKQYCWNKKSSGTVKTLEMK